MRTLDERNHASYTLLSRALRDLKLGIRLVAMILGYFTAGALVRRRYRRKEARGEIYWLDGA